MVLLGNLSYNAHGMAYEYKAPTLTVDMVIFRIIDGKLNVLLIQRANKPFKGEWALPGGYNAAGDTTLEAMDRVLSAKVGVHPSDVTHVEQLYTFDTVARDPRGPAVSVSYMGLTNKLEPKVAEATHNPHYFPLDTLPHLAYDHAEIVEYAVKRLQAKITYASAVYALLPKTFTLTQLQHAYEAILGRPLDKRNFRKKFLSFDLLKPTDKYFQDGAHRPALLYQFKQQKLQPLQRDFS